MPATESSTAPDPASNKLDPSRESSQKQKVIWMETKHNVHTFAHPGIKLSTAQVQGPSRSQMQPGTPAMRHREGLKAP